MKKLNNKVVKDLENNIADVVRLLDEVSKIDLSDSDKIFNHKIKNIYNKAKNIEKNVKEKYKQYLPKENLDSKK